MDRMKDVLHGIGGHDDFLSDCLTSGSASRLSLMKSLCDQVGRYDFHGWGEVQRIVADFCERHAPDLPLHHLRPLAVARKALGFMILAVAGVYGWSYLFSLVPQPYRLVLYSTVAVAGLLFCVIGPKVAAIRRNRDSEIRDPAD
jgi:hypothetical protein